MPSLPDREHAAPSETVSLWELFRSFFVLGLTSFGGPAIVVFIRQLSVEKKKWITPEVFSQGLALCQAVPGAIAVQCATWVGFRKRGLSGAIASFAGFVLPAFLLIVGLSILYQRFQSVAFVQDALVGLRAAVIGLVAFAAWSLGRPSIDRVRSGTIALVCGALFFAGGNPFLIVVLSGFLGRLFLKIPNADAAKTSVLQSSDCRWCFLKPAVAVVIFGVVLFGALFLFWPELSRLGLTMVRIDLVAFGGGYASIPLMFRELVTIHPQLTAQEFMDGIALGQVTPGPIVITATFAGYMVMGLSGAVIATIGIFLPSFFMVVAVDHWFSRLYALPSFKAVSKGLVLSFVGLMISVVIQFSLALDWTALSAAIAVSTLGLLLAKIDVMWIVPSAAVISILAARISI